MDIFALIFGGLFVNNFLMSRFLGICPFLGVSRKIETAAGMGIAVTFVMALSSAVTYIVYRFVLVALGIEYLYNITFILIIATLVQLVEMFIKKSSPSLYEALGVYLPLMATNCAVLGIVVLNMESDYSFIVSVLNATFSALGFLMVIVLFAGIRERMERCDIPKHFKGFPIALIASGLMSLAFLGFTGLIK